MPIDFDLESIRKEYNCSNYLETGLYDVRTDVSCKRALASNFDKVYSIEIRKDWIDLAMLMFSNQIVSGRLQLIHDDSTQLSKYILNNADFNNRTLFFLDAHVDNSNIHNYSKKCPVFDELTAIGQLARHDNILCIDDMRIMKTNFPWGETSYSDINFEDKIKEFILTINKDYKFKYLDGYEKDDILIAYV